MLFERAAWLAKSVRLDRLAPNHGSQRRRSSPVFASSLAARASMIHI